MHLITSACHNYHIMINIYSIGHLLLRRCISQGESNNMIVSTARSIPWQDFNPEKYEHLSGIFGQAYLDSGTPVSIVTHFLSVYTKGLTTDVPESCEPFAVSNYDIRKAYVACSLKGKPPAGLITIAPLAICIIHHQMCGIVWHCFRLGLYRVVCRSGEGVWSGDHSYLQCSAAQEEGGSLCLQHWVTANCVQVSV